MDKQLEQLLQPISGPDGCGEDLSFSIEFDRIQEARREDDPTVDYGEWQTTLKQADWHVVVENCTQLLATRAKDIRVAAWLAEGLVKTRGLQGLADGLDLMTGLLERFGADIHPASEGGDQEQRIGSINWYLTRMSGLLRQIALTRTEDSHFSLNDYESARLFQTQLQKNSELNADGRITLERIAQAAAKTDKNLYRQWLEDSERCRAAQGRLEAVLAEAFGDDAPSGAPLSQALDSVHQQLTAIAREFGIVQSEAPTPQAEAGHSASATPAQWQAGVIGSREQALDALREVAVFFRRTEPHSPVAYLAEKAVQWGSMPLHAWLRSVVKDNGTLSHLEEMLGLDTGPDAR
jgi:type VI secretion system protein ImpA